MRKRKRMCFSPRARSLSISISTQSLTKSSVSVSLRLATTLGHHHSITTTGRRHGPAGVASRKKTRARAWLKNGLLLFFDSVEHGNSVRRGDRELQEPKRRAGQRAAASVLRRANRSQRESRNRIHVDGIQSGSGARLGAPASVDRIFLIRRSLPRRLLAGARLCNHACLIEFELRCRSDSHALGGP